MSANIQTNMEQNYVVISYCDFSFNNYVTMDIKGKHSILSVQYIHAYNPK